MKEGFNVEKKEKKKPCMEDISERISKLNLSKVLFKTGMDITFLHASGPMSGKLIKIAHGKVYLWSASDVLALDESHIHGWYVSHKDMLIIIEAMEEVDAVKKEEARLHRESAKLPEDDELTRLKADPLYIKISKKYKIEETLTSFVIFKKVFFFWKAIHTHHGVNREVRERKCQELIHAFIMYEYNKQK